jgi:acetolactate synthase-1/2/3 large subunit
MQARSGGEILVASLVSQGVTHLFGVPGESYLPVLDALVDVRDRLTFVSCRQEGGAAYMAEAAGKLTGRPGVAIVTRGPGATNAAIGVHVAQQDSTPMVLLVGQVGGDFVDREAFQEVDYRRMYASVAKWAAQIDRAERVPEYVAHAFAVAMSGRPGPVVLALPEDMLSARATVADAPRVEATPSAADAAQIADVRARLAKARAPLVLVGGSRWDAQACEALAAFARRWSLPVACAFRRQDLFDHRSLHLSRRRRHRPESRAREARARGRPADRDRRAAGRDDDVRLLAARRSRRRARRSSTCTRAPRRSGASMCRGRDLRDAGRVRRAMLASGDAPSSVPVGRRAEAAHRDYEAWRAPRPVPGDVDLWSIVRWLDDRLPEDAIVTNGAGNYSTWIHRVYRFRRPGTQLAPYAGAMGYAVPAAIAAKLLRPRAP